MVRQKLKQQNLSDKVKQEYMSYSEDLEGSIAESVLKTILIKKIK